MEFDGLKPVAQSFADDLYNRSMLFRQRDGELGTFVDKPHRERLLSKDYNVTFSF